MTRLIRRSAACVVATTAYLACAAAAAQAPVLVHKDGLLLFPNVRIEAAPAAVATKPGSRGESGLKAYRDAQTGGLRQVSAEELLQEAMQQPQSNNPAGAVVTRMPDGRLSAQLDDSFLASAVVQKLEDGRLVMQCVPGESQASAWLKKAVSAKEVQREQ